MDRGQEGTQWTLIILTLVALVHSHPGGPYEAGDLLINQSETCKEDEYASAKGHCCNKCNPGHKLLKECSDKTTRSKCTKCANETYLEMSNNFENCFRCTKCKDGNFERELSTCTHTSNRVCGCIDGYYKKKISSTTWQCLRCSTCRPGQWVRLSCAPNQDTVCECNDSHYPLKSGECVPCNTCRSVDQCSNYCASTTPSLPGPSHKPDRSDYWIQFICVLGVFSAIATCIFGYTGSRIWRMYRNRRTRSEESPESPSSDLSIQKLISDGCIEELNFSRQESSPISVKLLKSEPPCVQDKLPDCVPCEFNVSQFIYFVLDCIPADRFKELMRCLGVSERDIERAERDNHTFKEGQYQMLRVWTESGGRGRGGAVSCPWLQDMVDTLKNIGLTACAEAIETKFGIH